MVSIWVRSETFTHGFFVMPASLWLIWQNKPLHPHLYPNQPSLLGLGFILINGFIWLLASLTHTLVIQQYTLVGILIGSLWFYLGNKVTRKLLFPLAFLYFMVPVGEALLPYLMEYTATFTIGLLRLTGISVYREGLHFSIISGNWSVIEACGGLRYLLSTITLGVIYAYITYTKTYKRTIFIIFSIILPIVANGFRAYMIVMIGHLSDMTLAVGIDHLIYGAIFYAFIIFILFFVGSLWKDPISEISHTPYPKKQVNTYTSKQNGLIVVTMIFSLGIWSFISAQLQSHYQANSNIPEWSILTENKTWHELKESPSWGWRPKMDGAVEESLRYFKKENLIIGYYQANFGNESQGSELVNTKNELIHPQYRKEWHSIEQSVEQFSKPVITANLATIRNNQHNLDITTLAWYQIGSHTMNNIYVAKLYQLYKRLTLDTKPEIYNILFFKNNENALSIQNLFEHK